jgi:two-component SAPR family response regulator
MRDSIIRDSLARIDSIHRADSIAYVDSVYRHAMSGFQGSISQQVPASQWWVFVLMLLLFGLLVIQQKKEVKQEQVLSRLYILCNVV